MHLCKLRTVRIEERFNHQGKSSSLQTNYDLPLQALQSKLKIYLYSQKMLIKLNIPQSTILDQQP